MSATTEHRKLAAIMFTEFRFLRLADFAAARLCAAATETRGPTDRRCLATRK